MLLSKHGRLVYYPKNLAALASAYRGANLSETGHIAQPPMSIASCVRFPPQHVSATITHRKKHRHAPLATPANIDGENSLANTCHSKILKAFYQVIGKKPGVD